MTMRMRPLVRRVVLALSIVGLGGALACSRAYGPSGRAAAQPQPNTLATPAAVAVGEVQQGLPQQSFAQQLIRRGEMALEVEDVSGTARRVERLATSVGGIIAQSSDDGKDDAMVAMRVPSERLDATMDAVAQLGHVERRGTNSQDVTEQTLDMDARIATLAATRDRLRQLLARSEAIRDVIEVERELARVQSELESLERRVTSMRGQVAMSDLSVTIGRKVVLGPVSALFQGIGRAIGKLFVWG